MSDGLVSNLSLVAGVAGASVDRSEVLVVGFAGLVAGALSMAVGEYVSVRANQELLQRELDIERSEIEHDPAGETRELAGIYVERGLDRATAMSVASKMMEDPDTALETHAREELGLDPGALGSPTLAAASSFAAFSAGAAIPLLPWLFAGGTVALVISLVLGVMAALALGAGVALLTRRSRWWSALRQAGLLLFAFVVTNLVGRLVGAAV
jgi:VIT1/CCC1 family predicted Fe2+/Mn2+ transporter